MIRKLGTGMNEAKPVGRPVMPGLMAACAALLMTACSGDESKVAIIDSNASPYASGAEHTEPVYYNGKTYQVRFRHEVARGVYQVNVAAQGRALGGSEGDQAIVSEVGRNAINHFACKDGQRAQVIAGSVRHAGSTWQMQARCV